ncbi:hypothetical protein FGRMN_9520 [Fusarium graminum]|nr:hypothetical protein FGRMN_9520 [Fusarium graminum]
MTDYSIYSSLSLDKTLFRLLVLHPATDRDQPIRCNLLTSELDTKPDFEALSYCWGISTDTKTISVCDKPFEATVTLHRALKGLRLKNEDRTLWVDAICINQSDIIEKNSQVPLMSRIYGDATTVVVWLDIDSECADLLREFHPCDYHWDNRKNAPGTESAISNVFLSLITLRSFFESPWWTRVWTVQELLLAKAVKFYFDDLVVLSEDEVFSVSASFFRHVCDCCYAWFDVISAGLAVGAAKMAHGMFSRVRMIQDALSQNRDATEPRKHGVPKLATMFRYRNATNPRDKLYGFLGIDSNLGRPPIDYRKPIDECYAVLTAFIMHKTSSLDVLNYMEPQQLHDVKRGPFRTESPQRTAGLPSWCPDWNYSQKMDGTLRFRDFKFHHFNASSGIPPHVFVPQGTGPSDQDGSVHKLFDGMTEEENRIVVIGFEMDVVRSVGDYYGQDPAWRPDIWRSWRKLVDTEMPITGNPIKEQDLMRAFSHTVCQGFAGTTYRNGRMALIKLDDNGHDPYFEELWVDTGVKSASEAVEETAKQGQMSVVAQSIGQEVVTASCGRRFFITEKGRFGMGYPNIESGDRVWILSGGRTPYILKRAARDLEMVDGSVSIYHFAGEAYVHGVMYGEAVKEAINEEGNLIAEKILLA